VICRAWGAVESLTVEDVAPPAPGRGQVLIDVKADKDCLTPVYDFNAGVRAWSYHE